MIKHGKPLTLTEAIRTFAPRQGGVEIQTDQPGKVHAWHRHSVAETLVVLEGDMLIEWAEGSPSNLIGRSEVGAGAVIDLPANTIHQSTNQEKVCRYLIVPEGGASAETHVFGS